MEDRAVTDAAADVAGEGQDVARPTGEGERVIEIATFVREYHQSVYRYAFRLTGSVADAEDLAQQTFLVAQRSLDQLRDEDRALAWLFAILRSVLAKSKRRQRPVTATDADVEPHRVPVVPSEPLDREALQLAIDSLPDEQKQIVLMYYMEDLPYRKIAEQLDLPIGTVMSRLSRAKTKLRDALAGDEVNE